MMGFGSYEAGSEEGPGRGHNERQEKIGDVPCSRIYEKRYQLEYGLRSEGIKGHLNKNRSTQKECKEGRDERGEEGRLNERDYMMYKLQRFKE